MGPRVDLDGYKTSRPHQDSIPRLVQPVASCYTDYAIPAYFLMCSFLKCVDSNILHSLCLFEVLKWVSLDVPLVLFGLVYFL